MAGVGIMVTKCLNEILPTRFTWHTEVVLHSMWKKIAERTILGRAVPECWILKTED